jgi:hypothetical protein
VFGEDLFEVLGALGYSLALPLPEGWSRPAPETPARILAAAVGVGLGILAAHAFRTQDVALGTITVALSLVFALLYPMWREAFDARNLSRDATDAGSAIFRSVPCRSCGHPFLQMVAGFGKDPDLPADARPSETCSTMCARQLEGRA